MISIGVSSRRCCHNTVRKTLRIRHDWIPTGMQLFDGVSTQKTVSVYSEDPWPSTPWFIMHSWRGDWEDAEFSNEFSFKLDYIDISKPILRYRYDHQMLAAFSNVTLTRWQARLYMSPVVSLILIETDSPEIV